MVSTGPADSSAVTSQLLDLLFVEAHTTNTFSDVAVEPAVIARVYETIRWAPTQMNSQPLRLTLIHTDQAKHRLAPHMRRGNRPKTSTAPMTILAAWDPNWHYHLDVLAPHREGAREKLDPDPVARQEIGQRSAHLQIGYLILGLRAQGLHVGPMTGFNATGVDEEFHTDTGWKTEAIINVGWEPNADDAKAVRPRAGRLSFDDACQIV